MQYLKPSAGLFVTIFGFPIAFFVISSIYGPRMVMIDSIIFYSVLFLLQAMVTERRFGTLFWVFSSLCVVFIGHLITYPLFNRGLDGILRRILLSKDPNAWVAVLVTEGVYGGFIGLVVGSVQAWMLQQSNRRIGWIATTILAFGIGYALQYWVLH
ncbi:hypothetical protein Hgul01_05121 [Herpetosiphon gulosus]|uniref:Uncharacterized protein n=1 Tax=Herpetosiphon gulosus TaxID=1973496 RepID=A0ABP9XA17_9CHLR